MVDFPNHGKIQTPRHDNVQQNKRQKDPEIHVSEKRLGPRTAHVTAVCTALSRDINAMVRHIRLKLTAREQDRGRIKK